MSFAAVIWAKLPRPGNRTVVGLSVTRSFRPAVIVAMFSFIAVIGLSVAAAGADAKVKSLDGQTLEGALTAVSTGKVSIQTAGEVKELPAAEVLSIDFGRGKPTEKPAIWVDLLDGSRLLAAGYTTKGGKATIELVGGQSIEASTRAIASVRFRPQDPELARQWKEIAGGEIMGDLLVTRKQSEASEEPGEETPPTSSFLDQLDGVVQEVGPETTQFQYEGETIPVKREKIEGIIYYHPTRRAFGQPVCRVVDAGGSVWQLQSVELKDNVLKIGTLSGVVANLPLSFVARIDFSVGNLVHLHEIEPDSIATESQPSLQPAALGGKFSRIFRLSASPPPGANQFRIAGKPYENGLSLHSPVSLVYRVPEDFRRFQAVAGVDDSVLIPGQFVLRVLGDGKELARHEFGGNLARGPITIDLNISGVRRITIELDPASDQDIGDQLNLCEARLTK